MIRNSWTPGAFLVVDDESGFTHLSTEMTRDWDGQMRHKDNLDGRHPQLDVRARKDPLALRDIRPREATDPGGSFFLLEDGLGVFHLLMEDGSGFYLEQNLAR